MKKNIEEKFTKTFFDRTENETDEYQLFDPRIQRRYNKKILESFFKMAKDSAKRNLFVQLDLSTPQSELKEKIMQLYIQRPQKESSKLSAPLMKWHQVDLFKEHVLAKREKGSIPDAEVTS